MAEKAMKGIILAGGAGTRLAPLTKVTSKQLLPVYNQPMIHYPLQTLITAGIRDILIIVAPDHAGDFLKYLGSGKEFGCHFSYEIQDKPEGLAQAFMIGKDFIDQDNVALILGDNLYEDDFSEAVQSFQSGGRIFAKEVSDPERFGVVEFDQNNKVISIEEKPKQPKSNYCVTGFYIYDNTVVEKVKQMDFSSRGELEITDLNNLYLQEGKLDVAFIKGRWFDTGTFESMYEATSFARERFLAHNSLA
jgi:glucose-1-phosphate thymidylyltransferase